MQNFTKGKFIEAIKKINEDISIENKRDYMDAHIIDLTFDTPIYRIFKIDRLISTLKEKKLCLVKPRLWDDPFENFLLNSKGILDDGTCVSLESIREQYYGQCWSLKEECDGLWRNYTSNSCKTCTKNDFDKRNGHSSISAKVKTTVGKLMDAFYDETNRFHSLCYFMGKARYLKIDDIVDYLKGANVMDNTNVNQVLSLLIKRESFSYEEEVRLVFWRPDQGPQLDLKQIKNLWDYDSDYFKFTIDSDQLFDEIELNPWIGDNECKSITDEIKKYFSGNIVKSKLYNHPFFNVKL